MLLDFGREELLVRPLGLRDRLLVTREKRCEVRLERGIEVAVGIVDGFVRHLPPPSQWAVAGLRPLSTVARPTPGSWGRLMEERSAARSRTSPCAGRRTPA